MALQIDIEFLIVLLAVLLLLFWFAWAHASRKFYSRRYKPENDKGRLGEENRKRLLAQGERRAKETIGFIPGHSDVGKEELLQVPTPTNSAGDHDSTSKNRKSIRELLKK